MRLYESIKTVENNLRVDLLAPGQTVAPVSSPHLTLQCLIRCGPKLLPLWEATPSLQQHSCALKIDFTPPRTRGAAEANRVWNFKSVPCCGQPCSHAFSWWRSRPLIWNRRCKPFWCSQVWFNPQDSAIISSGFLRRFPLSLFSVTRSSRGQLVRSRRGKYHISASSLPHVATSNLLT